MLKKLVTNVESPLKDARIVPRTLAARIATSLRRSTGRVVGVRPGIGLWLIAVVLLSAPFVLRSAGLALGERDNQIRQWLPSGFLETEQYDWFVEQFKSEEFVLASWEGASIEDPRLPKLAASLRTVVVDPQLPSTSAESDRILWFREVTTGAELVDRLQAEPLKLSPKQAAWRVRGTLLGPDGQTTGLLILLSDHARTERHAAVETIYRAAADHGVSRSELRLGGPTIESVALDQESERSRYTLTAMALVLSSLAAWLCLKDLRVALVVMALSLYCAAATLAWIHVFGDTLNLVMVTLPTLVYVLTISGAIHVTHYYRSALRTHGRQAATREALAAGWVPCVLTTLTTAIGLGSLMISHVTPVRLFGFYSALGVLTSLPLVLFLLPALLRFIPQRHAERDVEVANELRGGSLNGLGRWVTRWHLPVSLAGIAFMTLGLFGIARLTTSVKLTNFFSPQSRVIADYRWLESNLAALVPVEVVLRMPRDDDSRMVDRLELVTRVHQAIADVPEVKGVVSAATFAPSIPRGGGIRQVSRRAVFNRALERQQVSLRESGQLQLDGDVELWRVSARVDALNDVDYGRFMEKVRAAVEPVLDEHAGAESQEAVYTGVVPLIYKAQRVLLNDLMSSFLAAFALIALVMIVLFRGPAAGLVSMLPNTFPAIVVFGAMGWLGEHLDIGSMITASVALGIAVDDTIHFLSWFRRGLLAGMTRQEAILQAYRRCGMSMVQTTLICGLGMLGFAFSEFAPTARFAALMSTLLVAALLGDLLFLPALLAGPAGRLFQRRLTRVRTEAVRRPSLVPGPLLPAREAIPPAF